MTEPPDFRLTGRAATILGASVVLLEFMAAVTTFVASTLLPVVVDSSAQRIRWGCWSAGVRSACSSRCRWPTS